MLLGVFSSLDLSRIIQKYFELGDQKLWHINLRAEDVDDDAVAETTGDHEEDVEDAE